MQVLFNPKEMKKNIEFTKKIYEMKDLDGYFTFFDKFQENDWERIRDPKMNIETFLTRMENSKFFVSKLFMLEDRHIPVRYSVNARVSSTKDSLLEIHCDFTDTNFSRIYTTYMEVYNKSLLDPTLSRTTGRITKGHKNLF